MTQAKSGAGIAAALGAILVLAFSGCSSSDDNGGAPGGDVPDGGTAGDSGGGDPDGGGTPSGDGGGGLTGFTAMLNGSQLQYTDSTARARGTVYWIYASKSLDPNVGDFRLRLPLVTPGAYDCKEDSPGSSTTVEGTIAIGGDDSYATANARPTIANPCSLTIDSNNGGFVSGTISEMKLINSAGATATVSGNFTAQIRR